MFLKYESGIVKLGIVISLGLIFEIVRSKSFFHDISILIVGVQANAGAAHVAAMTPVITAQIIFFFICTPSYL